MKTAIYARKSTDDNERIPENRSTARQIQHAKTFATNQGWLVCEEHVYVDDAKSGADFMRRDGLLRLLNSLKHFDVIVMSELSRLGREQLQTSKVLADIQAKSVRIFFYLTGEELVYEKAIDKFLVSAVAFAAEVEREKASQRSRDALARKAEKGFNTGGSCYGYDNVTISGTNGSGDQVRSHTDYRINQDEVNILMGMFQMYRDGFGLTRIAKTLNGDFKYHEENLKYFDGRTPHSPASGTKKGTGSWAPSSIHAMLRNERVTSERYLGGSTEKSTRVGVRSESGKRSLCRRFVGTW